MGSSVLEDELDDVVLEISRLGAANVVAELTYPKLVLHEIGGIFVEFVQQRPRLILRKMLEASLQHATAVRVCRKFVHVPAERIDELQSVRRHPFYQLLNNLCK